MATTAYCTPQDFLAQVRAGSADDGRGIRIAEAVSRAVDLFCGRETTGFYQWDEPSDRLFRADCAGMLDIDDVSTTTGFVVKTDEDADGTFENTWVAADYQAEPLNNLARSWAFWKLRAVGNTRSFPRDRLGRALVQVTAQWGWPAVPAVVKEATLIEAARIFARRDAPFGVVAAPGIESTERLLAAFDPDTKKMLDPLRKRPFI